MNKKVTKDKLRYDLIPVEALEETVRAFMDGIKDGKYEPWDWLNGLPWGEYYSGATRHINAWQKGEALAPDSKVHHLGHAIANLMILFEYERLGLGKDDRRKPNKGEGCWD